MPLRDTPAIGTARNGSEPAQDAARRVRKTSEVVAMRIVKDIVDRGMVEGDRLPLEADMVRNYEVSRASLREALRILEAQGLIVLRPGRGGGPTVGASDPAHLARTATLYFHLDGTSYEEMFIAHLELECEVTAEAATNPDRRLVERTLRPFTDEAGQADGAPQRAHILAFHPSVASVCPNRVLVLLTNALAHIVRTHVLASMEPVHMHAAVAAEHGQLARAIIAGDEGRARTLTERHFRAQLDYYREHWPARLARPIEWR
ncbi:FadR/GntR family transcriptional regulator [Desertimonas flava]|uniref:FadR/GntR family transcriptional regulator n=1 Tax=Desertimonas flava TaxID=2064846 RepID=UPI000E353792|nr:GntR family transcriptional regulator [Desertimonas flava]